MTKERLSGWGNYPILECKTARIQGELQVSQLVNQNQKGLLARGLGRSYADQAISHTSLIARMHLFDKILSFDSGSAILHGQSGLSLDRIIRTFAPRGWFPQVNPGTKYVTLGGGIANDVHGKAHHVDGSFINCVQEFRLLLADGTVVNCSRHENSELFHANFGGLGLLGVILDVKIRLKKIATTYFSQKSIVCKNIDEMLDAIDHHDLAYDYSVAWVDAMAKGKRLGKGVLTVGNAAKPDELNHKQQLYPLRISPEPTLQVPFFLPDWSLNGLTVRMLNKVIALVQSRDNPIVHYEKFFFPLDAIQYWNRGYGKRGFIQYQFVIPLENGRANIRKLLKAVSESGCNPFLNVLKKFGEGQQYLSFPMPGYTFAIDFPVTRRLPAFVSRLDKMVYDCGGRIYLGKDATLDAEMFRKMYPQHKEWLKIKQQVDPQNVFSSALSERLKLHLP